MNKRIMLHIIIVLMLIRPFMLDAKANSDPLLLKASFLLQQNKYKEIDDILIYEPSSASDIPYFYLFRAQARFALNDFDGAEHDYMWLEENDNLGISSYNLARIEWIRGNRQKAFGYLQKHLKREDKYSFRRIMSDSVFTGLERDREWIRFWSGDYYSKFDDLIADANYEINNDYPDENVFFTLTADYPDKALSWDLMARYYRKTENKHEVSKAFKKAISLDPLNQMIMTDYADFLFETGKTREAISYYQKVLENNPYLPDIILKIIVAQNTAGDSQQANNELNNLQNLGIESNDIWFMMARQNQYSNPEKSVRFIDKLIVGNPLEKDYYNFRARLLQKTKDYEQALADWAMSLDIDPEQADVYFDRANLRYSLGEREGACHDWKRALHYGNRKAMDQLYKYCK